MNKCSFSFLYEKDFGFEFRWYVSESKLGNGKFFITKYRGIKLYKAKN